MANNRSNDFKKKEDLFLDSLNIEDLEGLIPGDNLVNHVESFVDYMNKSDNELRRVDDTLIRINSVLSSLEGRVSKLEQQVASSFVVEEAPETKDDPVKLRPYYSDPNFEYEENEGVVLRTIKKNTLQWLFLGSAYIPSYEKGEYLHLGIEDILKAWPEYKPSRIVIASIRSWDEEIEFHPFSVESFHRGILEFAPKNEEYFLEEPRYVIFHFILEQALEQALETK